MPAEAGMTAGATRKVIPAQLVPGPPGERESRSGETQLKTALERLLHQEEFSFHRPKHTPKGKREEGAYAQARRELQAMKKKPWLRGRSRADLSRCNGNPSLSRSDPHVGVRRSATPGAHARQEREEGRLWKSCVPLVGAALLPLPYGR